MSFGGAPRGRGGSFGGGRGGGSFGSRGGEGSSFVVAEEPLLIDRDRPRWLSAILWSTGGSARFVRYLHLQNYLLSFTRNGLLRTCLRR